MAKPNASTLQEMLRSFESTGLQAQLGGALFDPECWHQSLSDRFADTAENLGKLLEVGRGVEAAPFVLTLNRLRGDGGMSAIHWAFRSTAMPKGLAFLLEAIRNALRAKGFDAETGHTAHVTLSYQAKTKLRTARIPPINWSIDEFMLVRGGGKPYRYEVLERWPLAGKPEPIADQLGLF